MKLKFPESDDLKVSPGINLKDALAINEHSINHCKSHIRRFILLLIYSSELFQIQTLTMTESIINKRTRAL